MGFQEQARVQSFLSMLQLGVLQYPRELKPTNLCVEFHMAISYDGTGEHIPLQLEGRVGEAESRCFFLEG